MKKLWVKLEQKEARRILRKTVNTLLIIVLMISCVIYISLMFQRTNEQYRIRLQETGDEVAKNIDSRMQVEVEYLRGLAECFSNYEDIHCTESVNTLVRVSSQCHFTRMWLTKVDGSAISSELKESDASGREYLERAKRGESGISKVQNSRVNGERNVVLFAPTYYNGEVTGMVIGILKLDAFFDIIDVECFDGEGYCTIYTDSGEILVSTEPEDNVSIVDNKYNYSSNINILDWNVLVSFPDQVISGEIKDNMVTTVTMCFVCVIVLGIIIVSIFYDRNRLLQEKASHDSLTDLINRGTMENAVNEYMFTKRECDSVFMIFDIDKFKSINDSFGHSLGDYLLKQVGVQMKKVFDEEDYLCRMGGDEFAIFIEEVEERDKVLKKVEEFRKKIELIPLKRDRKSTVSIGVTFIEKDSDVRTFDCIYQKADQAMYKSKSLGGNRLTVYEEG